MFSYYYAKFRKMAKNCRTYGCHSHLIDKEVGKPSSLVDESLLTEREAAGITRLLIKL